MYLKFAWRYFKAKKSANAINIIAWLTVGVIAVATASQILVLSVFNGFEDLVKSLYNSFYTDIRIAPAKGKTILITPEEISRIKKINGIEGVSVTIEEKALLRNEDQQTIISLKGVDDHYAAISGVPQKTTQGVFDLGTVDTPRIVVGFGIQSAAEINVDGALQPSVVTLILPKKSNASIANPLESMSQGDAIATGVFFIQQEFDNKYAFTNIAFVKQMMGYAEDECSAVEIKTNANADFTTLKNSIEKIIGNKAVVQSKYEQNAALYRTMRTEKWVIYAVLTLVLIIAAFNMISALTMLVLEKKKDIGVLRSMGASQSMILKIFLSEGLLLGGIGAIAGIITASIVCIIQLKYKLIKLEGGSFLIDYFPVQLKITDFVLVAITAGAISMIASWLPASKAAMQREILKAE